MKPAWARPSPTMTWLYRVILFLTWCFFKVFYRHRVYGSHHFKQGSGIIAANHVSFYDPPVLAISSPEEVHFLARESLFKSWGFGGLIRQLNAHPVTGGATDVGVFKAIHQLLQEGKKVILFPEGTRAKTEELSSLKSGIAVLIGRAHSMVIPAYIVGTFSVWNRFRSFPKLFGKTACVFGSPIAWSEVAHLEKKEAQRLFVEKLSQSIQGLREWYEKGAKGSPP